MKIMVVAFEVEDSTTPEQFHELLCQSCHEEGFGTPQLQQTVIDVKNPIIVINTEE